MSIYSEVKQLKGKREKRIFLSGLSQEVKPEVENGDFETVNEAIIDRYKDGNDEMSFNTFKGWKEADRQVSKGSKSYPIWGKPRNISNLTAAQKAELTKAEIEKSEREKTFFPVANLFSSYQLNKQLEPA